MIKRIDECLNILSKISLDNLNNEYISKSLISYGNSNSNKDIKSINNIFDDVSDNNKKFVELFEESILISNVDILDDKHKKIELVIFNKSEFINENLELLIDYLNKKKIKFKGKLNIYDNIGYLSLNIIDCDDALKIMDYINCKLSKNIYSSNPLFFNMDNVMISINEEYSYLEILSMYLQKFLLKMNELKKKIDYDNFKDFILDNYSKIENQIEMYKFLEFNTRNIKLSTFFNNLEEITSLIIYLFNGNNYEEFKDYIRKLNRKNSKQNNKYLQYDNLDNCNILLEELVVSMLSNYGEKYTKENIINYKNTGKYDYITRKDNLRKKVMASKTFMIFLQKISLENEIEKILNKYKLERNKKILEEVCKETYLSYWEENKNYGKIQVARGLIRMSYGDYSAITRSNDARKNAIENIDSIDIIRLIKYSLCIDTFVKEEELFELYAEYIERLCTN